MVTGIFEKRDDGRRRIDWIALITLGATLLLAAFGAFRAYGDDHNALSNRVTAVETKQHEDDRWRERMENKIDRILERIK